MKKMMIFLLFFLSANGIWAQSGRLHFGREFDTGKIWDSLVVNKSNIKKITLEKFIQMDQSELRPQKELGKLTTFQESLVFQALSDFDYKPGEIYTILLNEWEGEIYHIYCEIQSDYSIKYRFFTSY